MALQFLPFSLDALQCKLTKKIKNPQKRAPRFFCNDSEISYEELSLKFSASSMNAKRLRALSVELYKTINN